MRGPPASSGIWRIPVTTWPRIHGTLHRTTHALQPAGPPGLARVISRHASCRSPVAIRQKLEGANTIASGVFSTADVLVESHLTNSEGGRTGLTIQMNQEVIRVVPGANEVQVVTRDRVREVELTYRGRAVVLAAGCFESARLAKRSEFPDPWGLIGKGTSDHPIFFTHFSIPGSRRSSIRLAM